MRKISTSRLFEILYVSTFRTGLRTDDVPRIAINSRASNIERGITGILIFDGCQFCQLLEGPEDTVCHLLDYIRQDKRHNSLKVLCRGPVAKRKFGDFAMGLATLGDDEEFLARLTRLDGKRAMKSFDAGVMNLDQII